MEALAQVNTTFLSFHFFRQVETRITRSRRKVCSRIIFSANRRCVFVFGCDCVVIVCVCSVVLLFMVVRVLGFSGYPRKQCLSGCVRLVRPVLSCLVLSCPVPSRPGAVVQGRTGLGLGLGWAWAWAGLGWAGLGWAGLGWAGLGWAGLGWCAVRCGAVRCGAVRCGAVRCGAVRCGAVRCGAVRWCVVVCGVVWCGGVVCGVWCGVCVCVWCVVCGVWCVVCGVWCVVCGVVVWWWWGGVGWGVVGWGGDGGGGGADVRSGALDDQRLLAIEGPKKNRFPTRRHHLKTLVKL